MECKLVLQPRPPSVIALSSRCTHQCLPVWAFIPRLELSVCHAYCLELHSCFPIHKLIPYLQGDRRAFMAGCWAIGVECVRTHFFEGLTLQQFFIIFWVVKALQEFVPSMSSLLPSRGQRPCTGCWCISSPKVHMTTIPFDDIARCYQVSHRSDLRDG